jgi:excisionase family DNA binding protein
MKFITTKEAAERLKVSRARIYQLIAAGTIAAEKLGRDYVIKESAIKSVKTFGKPGRPSKL